MSAFGDKWRQVRVGMTKQDVYSIIGKPDNAPDIGHSTIFGYDPEEFEFWNRDGKAYQCTFAHSTLRKKKQDGAEEEDPAATRAAESRPKLKDVAKGHCSVCGKAIARGTPFIMSVSTPDRFPSFDAVLKAFSADKSGMNAPVESASRAVCEDCMPGVLPRWIKNAGNAGLMIATNQVSRTAQPGELCSQCLQPAYELIWGVLNDNTNLYDWFWWCTSCKDKWWNSP